MSDFEGSQIQTQSSPIIKTAIIWGIISVVLTALMLTYNTAPMVLGATTLAKTGAFIVGSLLGLIGALVGDAVRKFAAPDMIFTSGTGSLIWQKIFWAIGPQSIGCLISIAVGVALVLS